VGRNGGLIPLEVRSTAGRVERPVQIGRPRLIAAFAIVVLHGSNLTPTRCNREWRHLARSTMPRPPPGDRASDLGTDHKCKPLTIPAPDVKSESCRESGSPCERKYALLAVEGRAPEINSAPLGDTDAAVERRRGVIEGPSSMSRPVLGGCGGGGGGRGGGGFGGGGGSVLGAVKVQVECPAPQDPAPGGGCKAHVGGLSTHNLVRFNRRRSNEGGPSSDRKLKTRDKSRHRSQWPRKTPPLMQESMSLTQKIQSGTVGIAPLT